MIFKKFFRKNILLIFKILLFTFISISFISLIPVFTKMIIDNYKNLSKNTIIIYSLGYALSIILYLLFELLKKINLNRLQKEYGIFIKHNIFNSITLMDHIDINSKKKGEYINNLTKDIDTVYENYILCSIQLLISLVTASVYLIYMINMNLFLSVIIIIASFIGFFIPRITGDKINIKRKNFSDKISDRNIEYFGNNLSFGQKAKIALSRALNSDKEILILDEIFANVDEKSELELTKKLIESEKTVILITHNRDNKYLDLFDEVIQIHKETI